MPGTLAAPFTKTTLVDAKRIVGAALAKLSQQLSVMPLSQQLGGIVDTTLINPILISRSFIQGDHWQSSYGWMGPRPQISDAAYTETMFEIHRGFVSKNVIGEIVARHVNGVVGIEPHSTFTMIDPVEEGEDLPADVEALIDEAEALWTEWWDSRRMHEIVQQVTATLLYAERAMLRLYIPRGLMRDEAVTNEVGVQTGTRKVIEARDLKEALSLIWPDHPLPEHATVALDEDTKEYIGVVVFKVGSTVEGTPGAEERAEVTYLQGDRDVPQTVIRSTMQNTTLEMKLDFGGRLPMYEMTRPLFITPQMWQSQRALNLATSMIPRGVVTAGFLERTILNAQMPGEWEKDENGHKTTFKPAPYYTGPGTTNFLQGIAVPDPETGKLTVSTPSVHIREPITTQPLVDAGRSHYIDMLEQAGQEHVLSYTNARASGKTLEQARADFTTTLQTTRARVEPMGRWLMSTLFAMAEEFSGKRGYVTGKLRPVFSCRIDTGPVSSDERKANDASVSAGTLSVESAIVRNGESDPDAELARIQKQPGAGLAVLERQAKAIGALVFQAGATLKGAALMMGLDEKLVAELVGDGTVQPPPVDDGSGDGNSGNGNNGNNGNGGNSGRAKPARTGPDLNGKQSPAAGGGKRQPAAPPPRPGPRAVPA